MINARLIVVGGATDSENIELALPAVLGRGRDATVSLPHPLVSRRHCELFESNDHLMVRDLGSTNGTFVGSERVVESILGSGELLTIGTVTFRAMYGEANDDDFDEQAANAWAHQGEDETEKINGDPGTQSLNPGNPPSDAASRPDLHPMPASGHVEPAREETLP